MPVRIDANKDIMPIVGSGMDNQSQARPGATNFHEIFKTKAADAVAIKPANSKQSRPRED
jgi:hypothetical protein